MEWVGKRDTTEVGCNDISQNCVKKVCNSAVGLRFFKSHTCVVSASLANLYDFNTLIKAKYKITIYIIILYYSLYV